MKLVKLTGCNGKPLYINPQNVNRISCYILHGTNKEYTDIEMICDGDENYYWVQEPIEEVVRLIEEVKE